MAGDNSTGSCPADMLASFYKNMEERIWRVDALLVASAILAGLIAGIGAYGQRYRHHRFTRSIFLGATTLLLPITSTVVSLATGSDDNIKHQAGVLWIAHCKQMDFAFLVVIWASLVQTIMINTSAVVAVDDREGRNIGPPFELLVQGGWTAYLISYIPVLDLFVFFVVVFVFTPFALNCAKTIFKWYAFEKARQSFALGRNPRLIFGYMQQPQLQETIQHGEPIVAEDAPPPLLVMGEERRDVDKHPHGFVFKEDLAGTMLQKNNGCVTIDRVWKLDSMLPMSKPQRLKDLCLSFALFKLLRCRFARYELATAISKDTFIFFWSLLLKDGGHDRVFGVIADELSFLHDYYYSSLPISYSKCWLPVVGFFISLLSVAYCIYVPVFLTYSVTDQDDIDITISCAIRCIINQLDQSIIGTEDTKDYRYFNLVPVLLFFVLVVIAEVRDMASYICSNWTKVALVCRLLNRASSQRSLRMQKWIGLLLRCRCKMMKHWDETMGQCSVLVLHPRTTPLVLLRRLLRLPDQKRKVKVSAAVKVCIIGALRDGRNGHRSNGKASLHRHNQVGESFLWACNSKSTSDIILTWHVATSILEVRHPYQHHQEQQGSPSISDCKIAASHLSRYCAYLVTWCPELLPDDDAWSKSLYEDVKKDAERVLAGRAAAGSSSTPEAKYQQLIELLSADAEHQVLKNGVRLGKQLVETTSGGEEETTWKLLAGFWSEMILYVAPSDNLKGHKKVIARGGELITLLWALLFHAGIVSRPGEDDDGAAATSAGVV